MRKPAPCSCELPKDVDAAQIHEIYQQIRELTNANGEPYVIGHTTGSNREMEILNNNDRAPIGTAELATLIDEKLGGRYDIDTAPSMLSGFRQVERQLWLI